MHSGPSGALIACIQVKGQWRTALVAEEAIARLLDIAANSLDSTLLERMCKPYPPPPIPCSL